MVAGGDRRALVDPLPTFALDHVGGVVRRIADIRENSVNGSPKSHSCWDSMSQAPPETGGARVNFIR